MTPAFCGPTPKRLELGPPLPPARGVRRLAWACTAVPPPTIDEGGDIVVELLDQPVDAPGPDAYVMRARERDGTLTVTAASATVAGRSVAARRVLSWLEQAGQGATEVDLLDWATVPTRGYMECFYGAEWSQPERLRLLAELSSWGFNAYVYGPASDPRVGAAWRDPYPAAAQSRITELVTAARSHGVDLIWRLAPSAPLQPEHGICFNSEADRESLTARLVQLHELGVDRVLLSFDDLNTGFVHEIDRECYGIGTDALAEAHVDMTNFAYNVMTTLGGELSFCPTVYWGTSSSPYRQRLAKDLHDDIRMFWTGPEVTSATIRERDILGVMDDYRSVPLLWDNFPVNDWDSSRDPDTGPLRRRLFIGPLTGRESTVGTRLAGYFTNLGDQPFLSLPSAAAAGLWAWQPEDDPEKLWVWAGTQPLADGSVGAHLPYAEHFSWSPLGITRSSALATAVARFVAALDGVIEGIDEAGEQLIATIDDVAASLRVDESPFGQAIAPWRERLVLELDTVRDGIELIRSDRHQDDDGRRRAAARISARREQLDADGVLAANGVLLALLERVRCAAGAPPPPADGDL